ALGIVGAGDLLAQIGLVVARVIPAEAVLERRLLEEGAGEIDGARHLVAVDDDGLAVGLDLMRAEGPHQRINPAMIVAETMAELEAEGMSIGLELGAGLEQLLPGVGEFVEAHL